jgi:hypothetical protein
MSFWLTPPSGLTTLPSVSTTIAGWQDNWIGAIRRQDDFADLLADAAARSTRTVSSIFLASARLASAVRLLRFASSVCTPLFVDRYGKVRAVVAVRGRCVDEPGDELRPEIDFFGCRRGPCLEHALICLNSPGRITSTDDGGSVLSGKPSALTSPAIRAFQTGDRFGASTTACPAGAAPSLAAVQ